MPQILPIPAICFQDALSASSADDAGGAAVGQQVDISALIAPPYDVLDETSKAALLDKSPHNIVAVDLPHLPAKTVGPDETYEQAGERYRQWLSAGVLAQRDTPALFVYQQTYTVGDQTYQRRSLLCDLGLREFGPADDGQGGVFPHEQTFSGPKEDRLKLMRATKAQLSPIFGLYSDPQDQIGPALANVIDRGTSDFQATTAHDGVLHECWVVADEAGISALTSALAGKDVFIADGHHRYNTALNYRRELEKDGPLPADHPANSCLFVLVALQDPGMIVLPTHRVLGGMEGVTIESFSDAASAQLNIKPFVGDLTQLEAALPGAGEHAMGLFDGKTMAIATPKTSDPLAPTHPQQSEAWRQLDVAILQHLIVEGICEPTFCDGSQGKVTWKFPHSTDQLAVDVALDGFQLGVVMQATPLESVRLVSEAGELMPQKSTFFYPKVATGLAINPLG